MGKAKQTRPNTNESHHCIAPGKLNLVLRILGRRDDDYHSLWSLLTPISLYDQLTLSTHWGESDISLAVKFAPQLSSHLSALSQKDSFGQSRVDGISDPERNLVVRAARILLEESGLKGQVGVSIELTKNLPFAAGLGGGSSDAASVLLALNKMLRLNLSRDELCSIGVRLGSDVPAFLLGELVVVSGVGDKISKFSEDPIVCDFLESIHFVLIKPLCGVDTSAAYASLKQEKISTLNEEKTAQIIGGNLTSVISRIKSGFKVNQKSDTKVGFPDNNVSRALPKGMTEEGLELLSEFIVNEFEEVVYRDYPLVAAAQEKLKSHGIFPTLLAGSGSSVVGFVRNKELAEKHALVLQRECEPGTFITIGSIVTSRSFWPVAKW